MIPYVDKPMESIKKTTKLLELMNKSGKGAGYNINFLKSILYLHTSEEQSKNKIRRNNSVHNGIKKSKTLNNKSNKKSIKHDYQKL